MLFFIQLILNVAVLYPYDATHPYDGQSFSWDESKPATAVMSATFYEEVEFDEGAVVFKNKAAENGVQTFSIECPSIGTTYRVASTRGRQFCSFCRNILEK